MPGSYPRWAIFFVIVLCGGWASVSWAELPGIETVGVGGKLTGGEDAEILTDGARAKLKARLERAVFLAYAHQPPVHDLAESGVVLDGAVVAIDVREVCDILTPEFEEGATKKDIGGLKSHSFFSRELASVSSPFHRKERTDMPPRRPMRQYYLTTADWLTFSDEIVVRLGGRDVVMKLEWRDEAQNVAVLSTGREDGVEGVFVLPAGVEPPPVVYVLLHPGTIYEQMTSHRFQVFEGNRYGRVGLKARNGYAIFRGDGRLTGLCVGPDNSGDGGQAVTPEVLSRALHPERYERRSIEDVSKNVSKAEIM